MRAKYVTTSHESFSHDSIESFGYDWGRIADPNVKPIYPLKIYLPQTTEDVVQAINETNQLGQKLTIRSKGHSSNNLVLVEKGNTLCTMKLDRILSLDESEATVTVQSGVVLAHLDVYLSEQGYGLPVIGDHNDITAGGFASVGGISPASHRYGMFVDNVRQIEYVTWEGDIATCSKTENRDQFYRLLTGLGRYGVITTLTLNVIRVEKFKTILHNQRSIYRDVEEFIAHSSRVIRDPGDAVLQRCFWMDLGKTKVGQVSIYRHTNQTLLTKLGDKIAHRYLHTIGNLAGRLPEKPDKALKLLGLLGMIFAPRRGTIKNVETFSDKVMDSSVGDPTRMLIVLAPADKYEILFRELYELFSDYRDKHKCFTFVSLYTKGIRSDYLSNGDPNKLFCELIILPGIKPDRLTESLLESLVSRMDDLCIEQGAFRYMHTRTVKDPERRSLIDPNTMYARSPDVVGAVGS